MKVKIESSWRELLSEQFGQPYFNDLAKFVKSEYKSSRVWPKGRDIFKAFDLTPVLEVKVVILGQDPYHTPNVANGLAFSTYANNPIPPSLKNIYKELGDDLGIAIPTSPDLSSWAKQGVLLLNATLTVREGYAGSHQNKGWEVFTDKAIESIAKVRDNIVFILWGSYARSKKNLIDYSKHCIIESAHPSPLSASRGFFGSKPFSKANKYLQEHGIKPINW